MNKLSKLVETIGNSLRAPAKRNCSIQKEEIDIDQLMEQLEEQEGNFFNEDEFLEIDVITVDQLAFEDRWEDASDISLDFSVSPEIDDVDDDKDDEESSLLSAGREEELLQIIEDEIRPTRKKFTHQNKGVYAKRAPVPEVPTAKGTPRRVSLSPSAA